MKVLIWIGCFLFATLISIIIAIATGFVLGFLPMYLLTSVFARKLCSKWDAHVIQKEMEQSGGNAPHDSF